MSDEKCPQCGNPIAPGEKYCKSCGTQLSILNRPEPPCRVDSWQDDNVSKINPSWPVKSKTTAGILAILVGDFGVHKFYLGKTGLGILYLCFCWTVIPGIIGLIEGIIYLCSSDEEFQKKNHVRLG